MVNTSCVDGSIVFIDPISFSVLKKIQFRYQDYEVPKEIKHSINHLREVLGVLEKQYGKTTASLFTDVMDMETQLIPIKAFVNEIVKVHTCCDSDQLWKACQVLDRENKGSISLDDFISFSEQVAMEQEEENQAKADSDLQDSIWPEWVVKEGKLLYA